MQPGWYGDNLRRHFPFLQGSIAHVGSTTITKLSQQCIVDCGFVFGVLSGYQPAEHSVWLHAVSRAGPIFTFTFRTDAPLLAGEDLDFSVAYPCSRFTVVQAASEEPEDCVEAIEWEGFVVLGDLSLFLTDGQILQDNDSRSVKVEDNCIQSLAGQFCTKIHVANRDRTRATSPAGCREICWPEGLEPVHVMDTCLTGNLWFREGYNCSIYQNDQANSIRMSAGVGAGAGEPCEDVPVYPGEEPPLGLGTLDGGLSCSEVVRLLGGISGPAIAIEAGPGVTLQPDQANHRIILDFDLRDVGVVRSTEILQDTDCDPLPVNEDPCACGDA